MVFSLGIMAGVDIRKPLGLLGAIAVPVFGLFILGSIVYHTLSLIRSQYGHLLPLLLINVVGILVYIALVIIVLTWVHVPLIPVSSIVMLSWVVWAANSHANSPEIARTKSEHYERTY